LPQSARNSIVERWTSVLATEDEDVIRGLLKRLATKRTMEAEVWGKLPPESKGLEGQIVEWAIDAYWVFPHLPRPIPKTRARLVDWAKQEWPKQLEKFTPFAYHKYTSTLCQLLYEQVYITKPEAHSYWKQFWSGDTTITPEKIVEILDQLRAFYVQLHKDQQAFIDTLPRVNRWNAKAHQRFFTEFLSSRFQATFDQPLDSIVAALTGVAFALPEGVASETVRGRRRLGKTPEKIMQKTR
jgi:hypothetical protein